MKIHLDRILKRNLETENGDIYILDSTVAEYDVNKLRKGKALKNNILDPEFIHSTTKGTVTGFQAAYLINLSKLSFEKLKIYSKMQIKDKSERNGYRRARDEKRKNKNSNWRWRVFRLSELLGILPL